LRRLWDSCWLRYTGPIMLRLGSCQSQWRLGRNKCTAHPTIHYVVDWGLSRLEGIVRTLYKATTAFSDPTYCHHIKPINTGESKSYVWKVYICAPVVVETFVKDVVAELTVRRWRDFHITAAMATAALSPATSCLGLTAYTPHCLPPVMCIEDRVMSQG